MALKPENQNPTKEELLIKLDRIAKDSFTDLYGMGILLKDTYRQLTDKQITDALREWKKTRNKQK